MMFSSVLPILFLTITSTFSLTIPPAPSQDQLKTLGYIKCVEIKSNRTIGYIRHKLNDFGEYIGVSPDNDEDDVNARLLGEVDLSATGSTSILVRNAPENNFPFLGGIEGQNGPNIGDSPNYLFIGGVALSSAGAVPNYIGNTFTDSTGKLRKAAGAFWQIDTASGKISPSWVNEDGSVVSASVGYINGAFILTGNQTKFEKEWDGGKSTGWINLIFSTD